MKSDHHLQHYFIQTFGKFARCFFIASTSYYSMLSFKTACSTSHYSRCSRATVVVFSTCVKDGPFERYCSAWGHQSMPSNWGFLPYPRYWPNATVMLVVNSQLNNNTRRLSVYYYPLGLPAEVLSNASLQVGPFHSRRG